MTRNVCLVIFIVVLALFMSLSNDNFTGAALSCVDGACVVGASVAPAQFAVAFAFAVFLLVYRRQPVTQLLAETVGIGRRLSAFLVDFGAVLLLLAPLTALPLLIAEYKATGQFNWSFRRDFTRESDDLLAFSGSFSCFAGMFLYFYLHSRVQRQTLGQHIAGYEVVPASEYDPPRWAVRVVFAFIGLCAWPVSLMLAARGESKAAWWDAATGTAVVRVVAASSPDSVNS